MKKIIIVVAGLLLSAGIFAQNTINDPNVQLRGAKNFTSINVSSAFEVFLTQGTEEKVAVSAADPDDLAHIVVQVKNNVLSVGWDRKIKWRKGNKKLKAYISFSKIEKLWVSGACNVRIEGVIKAEKDFKIDLSGASDLSGKVEVGDKLTVDLSGASDARLSGKADDIVIDANGASKFQGYEFAVDNCNASASGASEINIKVNKSLSAHASGASFVGYMGECKTLDARTSGASRIGRSGT